LQDRFQEKYKIISSTSSEAIDVKLDGAESTDMLAEILDLANADLELRIYKGQVPVFGRHH
jgi:hypothetical protein